MNEWMNTNMKEADNRIWKTWNPSHVQNDQNLVPLRNSSVSSLWMMVNVESRIGSFTGVWTNIKLLKSQSAICIHEGPMILQFQEEKMVSNSILCFFFHELHVVCTTTLFSLYFKVHATHLREGRGKIQIVFITHKYEHHVIPWQQC